MWKCLGSLDTLVETKYYYRWIGMKLFRRFGHFCSISDAKGCSSCVFTFANVQGVLGAVSQQENLVVLKTETGLRFKLWLRGGGKGSVKLFLTSLSLGCMMVRAALWFMSLQFSFNLWGYLPSKVVFTDLIFSLAL